MSVDRISILGFSNPITPEDAIKEISRMQGGNIGIIPDDFHVVELPKGTKLWQFRGKGQEGFGSYWMDKENVLPYIDAEDNSFDAESIHDRYQIPLSANENGEPFDRYSTAQEIEVQENA